MRVMLRSEGQDTWALEPLHHPDREKLLSELNITPDVLQRHVEKCRDWRDKKSDFPQCTLSVNTCKVSGLGNRDSPEVPDIGVQSPCGPGGKYVDFECGDRVFREILIDRQNLYQDCFDLLTCENREKLIEVERLYLQTINIDKSRLGQIREVGYYYIACSMFFFIIFGICNLEVNTTFCLGLLIFAINFASYVYFVKKTDTVIGECREQFRVLSKVRRIINQIDTLNGYVKRHRC